MEEDWQVSVKKYHDYKTLFSGSISEHVGAKVGVFHRLKWKLFNWILYPLFELEIK